jgi:chromate transporter
MKKKFVDECHWIEEDEMLDLVAIAQSSPGAIAVNGAIVVGYKLAGLAGALVAIVGTVIPPFLIISLISVFYNAFRENYIIAQLLEGMQAGVGAVIAAVVFDMGEGVVRGKNAGSIIIMLGAFIAACIFSINVVYIVIVCLLIGVVRTLINERRNKE